jgi:hypothetical protein
LESYHFSPQKKSACVKASKQKWQDNEIDVIFNRLKASIYPRMILTEELFSENKVTS